MKLIVTPGLLSSAYRLSVYTILFSAAMADDHLDPSEIQAIVESVGSFEAEDHDVRMAIRRIIQERPPIEESVRHILAGPGDLPVIVFLLAVDVIAADNVLKASEARFATRLAGLLGVDKLHGPIQRVVAKKLHQVCGIIRDGDHAAACEIGRLLSLFGPAFNEPAEPSYSDLVPQDHVKITDHELAGIIADIKKKRNRARINEALRGL
jgi:hypothetical protein